MSQPARPDPAHAPRARDRPAPAPPAHPQHRSPARRRLITAPLTPGQPTTAASPAATAARPQISARLPVSDWQIRWRLQPDGRTVLEVTGQAGDLTGLAASTRLPIVSVDGAWRGTRRSADGTQQAWALAIGHAYPPDGPLTVTFTRRARPEQNDEWTEARRYMGPEILTACQNNERTRHPTPSGDLP
jgi:hypothetical protein